MPGLQSEERRRERGRLGQGLRNEFEGAAHRRSVGWSAEADADSGGLAGGLGFRSAGARTTQYPASLPADAGELGHRLPLWKLARDKGRELLGRSGPRLRGELLEAGLHRRRDEARIDL